MRTTNAVVTGMAENDDNDGNGTIMIDQVVHRAPVSNLLIQGVKLDVSSADGAVTVTLAITPGAETNDFIRIDGPSSAIVISGIKVGVEPSATAVTVRTRGTVAGGKMVSLTLKETFKGAFMTGDQVTVDFSGIPKGATLTAMVTSNPVLPEKETRPSWVRTRHSILMSDPFAMAGAVKDGSVTVTLGVTGRLRESG